MRRAVRFLTLLPLLLAFGCSTSTSTRSSRIEKNKKLFHTYPPSVQRAIRSGQIQRGFDQNKVYMSLGKATKKEAAGASETWLYAKQVRKKVTTKKDGEGATAPSTDETKYLKRTRVVRVVKFTDGRVSSWEDPPAQYLNDWHE
ncbi:MAG: hypothetical protein ACYTDU_09930 [Planctomycetota bacterium]|jgi:hypothetical protein